MHSPLRYGQPDARDTGHKRQPEKASHLKDEAAQQREGHGRTRSLDTLVIDDRDDVDGKEDKSGGKERKPLDGYSVGGIFRRDEHRRDPAAGQRRCKKDTGSEPDGRSQRQVEGPADPVGIPGAEVIAQDGLGRLSDGVVDHEDDREEVAGDAEGRHTVLAQIADEDVIAREHHRGDGRLAEEARQPQPTHVADVATRQAQAFAACLHAAEANPAATPAQVDDNHHRPDDIPQTCGQCRPQHAPAADEDEDVVQHDVDDGRHDVAKHGVVGRAVQTDEEHPGAQQRAEGQERHKPAHVLDGQRQQPLGTAQQPRHLGHKERNHEAVEGQQQRRDDDGLRDVDTGRAELTVRKVNRRHDRRPDTEHQTDPRADEEERRGDVDRRQSVAADAVADEDAVRDDEGDREDHPQHRRDQQTPEQLRNVHPCEIDTVFHRFRFWVTKIGASACGKINIG